MGGGGFCAVGISLVLELALDEGVWGGVVEGGWGVESMARERGGFAEIGAEDGGEEASGFG